MTTRRLRRDPRAETYEDVKKLIYKTCYDYARRYGGDIDELVSIGNEAYCVAYSTYDATKNVKFATWVRTQVWYAMKNAKRAKRKYRKEYACGEYDVQLTRASSEFDLDNFAVGLTPDSQFILGLIQSPPDNLINPIEAKGGHGYNWRSTLRTHLIGLGWTVSRVLESYEEIRNAYYQQ